MKRGQGLVVIVVLVVALFSFTFFNIIGGLGQRSASSALTPTPIFPTISPPTPDSRPTQTPLPPAPVISRGTPLPTPDLGPSPTPQPTIPSITDITPLPPVVTNWSIFQGTKTGFSFSYPAGWNIIENSTIAPAYSADPQVTIHIANYDLSKAPGRGGLPSGAMKIDLLNYQNVIPSDGTSFSVGPQRFSGRQNIFDRSTGAELLPGIERTISIHFTAANRNWVILAGFGSPKATADKNMDIFYQIIGSVRYANK